MTEHAATGHLATERRAVGQASLLVGLSVLEIGNGIAGGTAAAVLADLGASVVKWAPAERDCPAAPLTRAGLRTGSLLMTQLDVRKSVCRESGAPPGGPWHVVIDDRIRQPQGTADPGLVQNESLRTRVTITAFGLGGSNARKRGSDIVALAAGGALTVSYGPDGSPVRLGGWQGLLSAGYVAALGALHGLSLAKRESGPVEVDVSAQDAVIFTCVFPECAHGLHRCPGVAGGGRYTSPSGLFPTADGLIRIAAIDEHQWDGVRRTIGNPAWSLELNSAEERQVNSAKVNDKLAAWTQTRKKAEIAREMQRNGAPAAAVNGARDVLDSPHLRARGFFGKARVNGEDLVTNRAPYLLRFGDASPPPSGDGQFWSGGHGRTLDEITIVEATHVLAAPIAGALLGGMGVRTVRLEDLGRLDMYRRNGPFAEGTPGIERGAYFLASNANKESLAFSADNLADVGGIVLGSDVVFENVGASRLQRWGLDLAELAAAGRLTVSVSGFGTSGPLAGNKAYANVIHAYAGLTDATRTPGHQVASVDSILADPSTSVLSAILIAAWAIGPQSGVPAVADIAMVEVMASRLIDYLAADELGDQGDQGEGAPGAIGEDGAVPDGLFRTADDTWVALTVRSDDWAAFDEIVGPFPEAWRDETERLASGCRVVDHVRASISRFQATDLVERLQARGVAAARLTTPRELWNDAELRARGLFQELPHDELGTYWALTQPWRAAGSHGKWLGAPLLGSWNRRNGRPTPDVS